MGTKQLLIISALVAIVMAGCQTNEANTVDKSAKVGIYDSRVVAYAYWSEEVDGKARVSNPDFNTPENAFAYWNAIVDGKPRYVPPKDDKLKGKEFGYMLHQQVFSYHEPVQAFEQIANKLDGVMDDAGVDILINKWEKDELARYNKNLKIDITDKLVELFNPTEEFLKNSKGFEKEGPLPLDTNWLTVEK